MNICKGDHVLVNLAPFIGSRHRSKQSVPCEVVAIHDSEVEVRTRDPFREFSMRVLASWIEGKLEAEPSLA